MDAGTIYPPRGLKKLMSDYVAANLWANRRCVAWLQRQPVRLLEQTVPSSFQAIKGTLVHIWDVERFWLAVLQQTKPYPSFRDMRYQGPVAEVFAGLVAQSAAFEAYVAGLDEPALQEERLLETSWAKGRRPQYDFIQHCMTHSAYHRGQIVTMSHQLGIPDAPMTDFNAYLMFPG